MKLTDRVYLVGGSAYGISPTGDCNVYLIDGGDALALVDSGGGFGGQKILENVKKMGLDPSRIEILFNTHCHFDHIGANKYIQEQTGCRVAAHEADKNSIETLDQMSLYSMARTRGLAFEATEVETTLKDGDVINLGDLDLKIVHNPGHTPGCFSVLMEEDDTRSLLCGDIAGANGKLGYINGPGFSLPDWKQSIKRLIQLNPERMYPGHNTFLLGDATEHLRLYDMKLNAAWTTIVTSIG